MTDWIDKGASAYCKLREVLLVVLLAAMVVMVFGNVVLRYAFNSGITESEELSRWAFIWMTFLGAIVAIREGAHLGTDMLVGRFGPTGKKICLGIAKAYPSCDDEDCYVITGTNGSLSVPTMRLKTYPRPEDRSWWKPFEGGVVGMVRDDPLKHQLEHFGAVIRGETEPLASARDGLANLRITEAVVAAAKSGSTVEITPPLNPPCETTP